MNETKGNKSKGVREENARKRRGRNGGDQSGAVYPVFAGVR